MTYLLLFIIMLVLVNTYGHRLNYKTVYENNVNAMYRQASSITNMYNSLFRSNLDSMYAESVLFNTEKVSGYGTMAVKADGEILFCTENEDVRGKNIFDYSKTFLNYQVYSGDALKELLSDDNLYVICPVSRNMKLRGYVIEFTSLENIEEEAVTFSDNIIICFILFMCILFFIMTFLYLDFKIPMMKLISAARNYANGIADLSGKRPHNDFADLYDSIKYIGEKSANTANEQKEFIANVSHDFRSPLTSIKGYTQAFYDGTIPPEEGKKYYEIILFETERLIKMTNNILELNKFDSATMKLERLDFDLIPVIRMSAAPFERRCREKNITIDLVFSSETLMINADQDKIEQVIQNLLDNAVKFSHEGGNITVSTSVRNSKAFVSVKDNGIGISSEAQNKIWDRFFKIDSSRGRDKKGSGLGLSITKEIIDAHGENISCISTPGAGTEFIFSLKAVQSEM
jgi:signal transduction histidine kinase